MQQLQHQQLQLQEAQSNGHPQKVFFFIHSILRIDRQV